MQLYNYSNDVNNEFLCRYAAIVTNIWINVFFAKNSFIKSIMLCPSTVSHLYSFNGADTLYECKIDTVVICKRVRCGLLKTANVQLLLYSGGKKKMIKLKRVLFAKLWRKKMICIPVSCAKTTFVFFLNTLHH